MSSPALATPTPRLPRLLLADDHHLILDALRTMMKDEFDVFAVDSGQTFLNAMEDFRPEIAVLDISMPGGDGFLTARKVLHKRPSLPIVFLSMYGEPSYVEQAAQVGGKAYLSKRTPAKELMSALHSVLNGNSLLPEPTRNPLQDSPSQSDLTARQQQVLKLIAAGCSAKEIANALNVSVRTAEFHRAAIMQRLDLHSTAQLTRYAIRNHLA